jgi:hypothetical protein
MATPEPTPPIEDLVQVEGTIDVRTVGANLLMGTIRRTATGWRAYDQTDSYIQTFDRYELARQAVEQAYVPPPPAPRPVLFGVYTFNVRIPPTLAPDDATADALVAKLNDAFDKIEGAARNLLAEINPAITVTMEDP